MNYLAEYAYRNTTTDDLWAHLSQASNRPQLSEILSTWTKQMGYPLLTVGSPSHSIHSHFWLVDYNR